MLSTPLAKPSHQRCCGMLSEPLSSLEEIEARITSLGMDSVQARFKIIARCTRNIPEFAPVIPNIGLPGTHALVVGLRAADLEEIMQRARLETGWQESGDEAADRLPGFSHNDLVTAHVWRAQCLMRCKQIGIDSPETCEETTTCARACNVRERCKPVLGAGYFGNAVVNVLTEVSVSWLATSKVCEVAKKLRQDLQHQGSADVVAATAQRLRQLQVNGRKQALVWDKSALTLIVSSWSFPWQDAAVAADAGEDPIMPVRFEHGALTPLAVVLTPQPTGPDGHRARQQGWSWTSGMDVWACGPIPALQHFGETLMGAIAGPKA